MIDNAGIIWFGSNFQGLCKYDPVTHEYFYFKSESGNKISSINNNIKTIQQTSKGNIFIGTLTGLFKYRPETNDFLRLKPYPNDQIGKNISTHKRRPLELIFYEAYLNKKDARRRER